jgi:hypothetical protein
VSSGSSATEAGLMSNMIGGGLGNVTATTADNISHNRPVTENLDRSFAIGAVAGMISSILPSDVGKSGIQSVGRELGKDILNTSRDEFINKSIEYRLNERLSE